MPRHRHPLCLDSSCNTAPACTFGYICFWHERQLSEQRACAPAQQGCRSRAHLQQKTCRARGLLTQCCFLQLRSPVHPSFALCGAPQPCYTHDPTLFIPLTTHQVLQYPDYAAWQAEWLRSPAYKSSMAYWQQQLAGVGTSMNWPADRPRPKKPTGQGATLHLMVTDADAAKVWVCGGCGCGTCVHRWWLP